MLGIITQVKIPTIPTIFPSKKNDIINIIIAIGKDKYPISLCAIFQVSSSLIVQGNLNPKYLLKGILGDEFQKIIIKADIKPIINILLSSVIDT